MIIFSETEKSIRVFYIIFIRNMNPNKEAIISLGLGIINFVVGLQFILKFALEDYDLMWMIMIIWFPICLFGLSFGINGLKSDNKKWAVIGTVFSIIGLVIIVILSFGIVFLFLHLN